MPAFRRLLGSPSAHIMLGLAIGQGTIYLSTPLLTRLYTPDLIGLAGVFLAASTVIGTVATLRLELALPTADDLEVRWIARRAITVALAVSGAGGIGYLLFRPGEAALAAAFIVTIFALAVVALSLQLATRLASLRGIAFAKALQGPAQIGVQLLAAISDLKTIGLQIGYAAGYTVVGLVQYGTIRRRLRRLPRQRPGRERVQELNRKAIWLTFSALLNVGTIWVYPFLLQALFGAHATGEYTVAQRLAIAPVGLVVAALLPVVVTDAGRLFRENADPRPFIRAWILRLLPFGSAVFLVLLLIPDAWLVWFLGPGWEEVGNYLGAISLMAASQVVIGPLSQLLVLSGRATAQFIWDGARLVAILAVSVITATITGDPVTMVWSASIVTAIFYAAYGWMILRGRNGT